MSKATDRVPVRSRALKLRTEDPVGYDPAKQTVYRFNATADAIVRLVDGDRSERDIARAIADGDAALADELLVECRAFFDRCVADGLIEWAP